MAAWVIYLDCSIFKMKKCNYRAQPVSQFSQTVMSKSLQPHGLQLARLPCPSPTTRTTTNSCPLSQRCHPTISSFIAPFSSCLNLSQHQGLFQWVSSHQVAKVLELSTSVLPMKIQDGFPLGLTGSPCCPRDSQDASPALQFKSISSLAFSFLYGSSLTSIHDYWKNHNFY